MKSKEYISSLKSSFSPTLSGPCPGSLLISRYPCIYSMSSYLTVGFFIRSGVFVVPPSINNDCATEAACLCPSTLFFSKVLSLQKPNLDFFWLISRCYDLSYGFLCIGNIICNIISKRNTVCTFVVHICFEK